MTKNNFWKSSMMTWFKKNMIILVMLLRMTMLYIMIERKLQTAIQIFKMKLIKELIKILLIRHKLLIILYLYENIFST